MDTGRSRGEGRRHWPDEADNDVAGQGWRRPRDRRGHARHSADWLNPPEQAEGSDPAQFNVSEFSVSDFRDQLLSGPVSELYGVADRMAGGEDQAEGGGFTAFGGGSPGPESQDRLVPSPVPRQADSSLPQDEDSGLVRPYFRTRGRTKPSYDLALEALVSTSERGRVLDRVRVPEHRSICDLCLDTRSVAEVAALLGLPLGVVRVLVGDVAGLGLVLVHTAGSSSGDRPSIEFMERVLSGLRRI